MPWTHVWRKAANETKFWKREVDDECLRVLAKAGKLSDMVDGDAPVASPLEPAAPSSPWARPPSKRSSWGGGGGDQRPAKTSRGPKQHNVVDGEYRTNRAGWGLCADFQSGRCRNGGNGLP